MFLYLVMRFSGDTNFEASIRIGLLYDFWRTQLVNCNIEFILGVEF